MLKSVVMLGAIALFSGQAALAECAIFEDGFDEKLTRIFLISDEIKATLSKQDDSIFVQITLDNKQMFAAQLHGVYWDGTPDMGAPQIIAHDVNNDGVLDVFVGTGQGMVNNYYQALISQGGGRWDTTILVSNPDFTCGKAGFGSWYRSGPRGTEEYWAIGDNGLPYTQITQTIIDSSISHRVVYDAAGNVVSQSIVDNMHDIRKIPALYHAKTGPMQGGTPVYETKDTGVITATLAPGSPVILVGSERTYSRILVEYGANVRGWIPLEYIVCD